MWYRKRHVAEKFRYHIGNTDTTSVFSVTTSVFPMWYRNISATCLSDTTSEIISNRVEIQIISFLVSSVTVIELKQPQLFKKWLKSRTVPSAIFPQRFKNFSIRKNKNFHNLFLNLKVPAKELFFQNSLFDNEMDAGRFPHSNTFLNPNRLFYLKYFK
jgi:hypothetical protein